MGDGRYDSLISAFSTCYTTSTIVHPCLQIFLAFCQQMTPKGRNLLSIVVEPRRALFSALQLEITQMAVLRMRTRRSNDVRLCPSFARGALSNRRLLEGIKQQKFENCRFSSEGLFLRFVSKVGGLAHDWLTPSNPPLNL